MSTNPASPSASLATPPPALPPSRLLVAALVTGLCIAGLILNLWATRRLHGTAPSLRSGLPGLAVDSMPDPGGTLTIDEVASRAAAFVELLPARERNVPCVWYRITALNQTESAERAVLALTDDFTKEATLYHRMAGGGWKVQRTGSILRWSDRAIVGPKRAFALLLPAQATTVVYVRVSDSVKQPDGFLLWNDTGTYRRSAQLYEGLIACYLSLWLGLVSYNAFLYAVLRRRDYLLYLNYVLSLGALVLVKSDVSAAWLPWPHWPLQGMLVLGLINLTTFNLVRFSRVFLETATRAPGLDRWMRAAEWVVAMSTLALVGWLRMSTTVVSFDLLAGVNILVLAMLLGFGVVLFRRRGPQAGLYVLTFLPLIGGLILTLRANLGLPDEHTSGFPLACGSALELIFLSLALAWRYRRITDEAERLQAEYTARLETDVTLHTRELRGTNESLARTNRDKDRIFAIIGHDLRGPAQSLSGLAHLLATNTATFTSEELASLAKDLEKMCRAQLDLLDNLLHWGRMQSGNAPMKPVLQNVAGVVDSATATLAHDARAENVRILVEVERDLGIYADAQGLVTIMRNLLGNALKFTSAGGMITVRGRRRDDSVELSVQDTGVGMSAERLAELFTGSVESQTGVRSEKGAGIGLTLCRDLTRANRGELKIQSELGRGTTVVLILPAAAPRG